MSSSSWIICDERLDRTMIVSGEKDDRRGQERGGRPNMNSPFFSIFLIADRANDDRKQEENHDIGFSNVC